jgi:hypothetical protein
MRKEFTLRNLHDLSNRLNQDQSWKDKDWRLIFHDEFELDVHKKQLLDELEHDEGGKHHQEIQQAFHNAAEVVSNGGKLKLRVFNIPGTGRRVLKLEVASSEDLVSNSGINSSEFQDTPIEDTSDASGGIICCCADCTNWHFCWKRNPCTQAPQ